MRRLLFCELFRSSWRAIIMLEIPEAIVIANQLNQTVKGRKIARVVVGQSPHKFAFFLGDPQLYEAMLIGKSVSLAGAKGGMVAVEIEDATLVFADGVDIRYQAGESERPHKHQLLVEFTDQSSLSVSIQMYGGIWCFLNGEFDNLYYQVACQKPSPLTEGFDWDYFVRLITASEQEKLSAKALLATEQRIPGLGNGVLQDILYFAIIHPKKKADKFTALDQERLFHSIKDTLAAMVRQGGRDTERDLFGQPGGYPTRLSRLTAGKPCPVCGQLIRKEAYLGGSIYFCEGCQVL
jgi:formamidopyrimidine-DNA glycosylase